MLSTDTLGTEELKVNNDIKRPSGWKLVPVEPTSHMLQAACGEEQSPLPMWSRMKAIYTAMTAAAPEPPAPESKTVTVRYDLSPAETDSAIHDHLIKLGWTPPPAKKEPGHDK